MTKRYLAVMLVIALLSTMMCGINVFAYDEYVTGCPTTESDMYSPVEHSGYIGYNSPGDSYSSTPYVVDADAGTMTITQVDTNTGTTGFNTDAANALDMTNIQWLNTGTIVLTYDATLDSLDSDDGMLINVGLLAKVCHSGGNNKWPTSGTVDKYIVQCHFPADSEDGTVIHAKTVYRFTPDVLYADIYAKADGDEEYTYQSTNEFELGNNSFSKDQYAFYKLLPYGQSKTGTGTAVITFSNIQITEAYGETMLEDISGNYLQILSKDVNYYIPEGYSTAELTFGGETLATFSSSDDAWGSYKTTIDFSQFDVGDDIPLTLTVEVPEAETQTKTVYININEPITVASMADVSGSYPHTGSVTVDYEIPHAYETATLTFGGEVVAEYDSESIGGGGYSTEIVFADYDATGEDIPVTLTVTGDGVASEITYYVDIFTYYPDAELSDVSGYYIRSDSITVGYTIPTDYAEASLTLGDYVVAEFDPAEVEGGEYTEVVDLSSINFNDATSADVNLTLTVDGESISRVLTVYNNVEYTDNFVEDFEGELKANTLGSGVIDSTTFDSKVYKYTFDDGSKKVRQEIRSQNVILSKDWIVDISCDFCLTDARMQLGLSLRNENNSQYAGTPNYWMASGKFMDRADRPYEANRWYHLTYRIIPRQYKENGKGILCMYIDGEYIGDVEIALDLGLGMIALDMCNGAAATGDLFVDNMVISSCAPCYDVEVIAVDNNGNTISAVDYANPRIAVDFNQNMNAKTISTDTIKLKSFNGTPVDAEVTYDSEESVAYVVPAEALVAGSDYVITLSKDIKSIVGGSKGEAIEYVFTTKTQPVFMGDVEVPTLSALPTDSNFAATVTVTNDSGSGATGYLYAAYFCGDQLQSISSVPVSGSTSTISYALPLRTRGAVAGERMVAVFYVNDRNDYTVIDTFESR